MLKAKLNPYKFVDEEEREAANDFFAEELAMRQMFEDQLTELWLDAIAKLMERGMDKAEAQLTVNDWINDF